MDFKEATDRLFNCGVTANDVAAETGLSQNSILRMRLDPDTDSYRRPPDDWPKILSRVALSRVTDLTGCATDLEALAAELS